MLTAWFLVPASLDIDPDFYFLDRTGSKLLTEALGNADNPKIHPVVSENELMENLQKNSYSFGVIINEQKNRNAKPVWSFFQSRRSKKF